MDKNDIKKSVRDGYAEIARKKSSCCSSASCCGGSSTSKDISRSIGYTDEEMNNAPEGANLGLGCGNPVATASLKEGETVLDLGSGAGFDAFLASGKVGKTGHVIGVDMTQEMLEKARLNAAKGDYANVEFRLGEIENIPVDDNSVDVIISNCVINLSPDKKKVFQEAYRVLKPGGRIMVSDIVLIKPLPEIIKNSVEAYVGCLAGAVMKEEYFSYIKNAGFESIEILSQDNFPVKLMENDATANIVKNNPCINKKDLKDIDISVASVKVRAVKPQIKR